MRLTMRSRFSVSFCLSVVGAAMFAFICVVTLSPLAYGTFFDPLFQAAAQNNSLNVDTRHMYLIGFNISRFNDVLGFHNRDARCRSHHRIEVARGFAENQVAPAVGLPRMNERKVCFERAFHHVSTAIKVADFFAFGYNGANSGGRKESRDTGATRSYAFR